MENSDSHAARLNVKGFLIKKYRGLLVFLVPLLLLSVGIFVLVNLISDSETASNNLSNTVENFSDPIARGRALSGGNCAGSGSKILGTAPMNVSDLSVIIPYGLVIGGHVTPIDHQYYWGKEQFGSPDMYNVLMPSDGKLVNIGFRDRSHEKAKVKGDYRLVFMYSCTFFSYYDLVTSLSDKIKAQLPDGWESIGYINTNIDLKEGDIVGKVGAQSLDFAVWDTTKTLENLLVPVAYDNGEPWKLSTVPPLDYFSEKVRKEILPFYARDHEPLDGQIDYDKDGYVSGNWFLEGTNGYVGVFEFGTQGGGGTYWTGHLSIAPNHMDPSVWIFSIGELNGEARQFAIKNPSVLPDMLDKNSGIVIYELTDISYIDKNGNSWNGESVASGITLTPAATKGTVLLQMLDTRLLKLEVFLDKHPLEVSEFTENYRLYDRGDNAKMVVTNKERR